MTIHYIEGNILNTNANIICHSVNHQGVMGSGLAKQLKDKYPEIMDRYMNICKTFTFEIIRRNGIVAWQPVSDGKYVASIFGQDKYGRDKKYTDYISLGNGLEQVRLFAVGNNLHYSIAIPFGIGCGLGGGQWSVVQEIIEETFSFSPNIDVYIYKFSS